MKIYYGYTDSYPLDSENGKTASSILLGIGLVILVISLFFVIRHELIRDELVEVEAVVTHITGGKHSSTYVSYVYGGETYTHVRLNSWSPGLREGSSVTVSIHPDRPGKTASSMAFFFLLFGLLYTGTTGFLWYKARHPGHSSFQTDPKDQSNAEGTVKNA